MVRPMTDLASRRVPAKTTSLEDQGWFSIHVLARRARRDQDLLMLESGIHKLSLFGAVPAKTTSPEDQGWFPIHVLARRARPRESDRVRQTQHGSDRRRQTMTGSDRLPQNETDSGRPNAGGSPRRRCSRRTQFLRGVTGLICSRVQAHPRSEPRTQSPDRLRRRQTQTDRLRDADRR